MRGPGAPEPRPRAPKSSAAITCTRLSSRERSPRLCATLEFPAPSLVTLSPLLRDPPAEGYDIRTIQELGDRNLKTTMIYTHVLNRGGHAVLSPAEALLKAGFTGLRQHRQLDQPPPLLPATGEQDLSDEEDAEDSQSPDERD